MTFIKISVSITPVNDLHLNLERLIFFIISQHLLIKKLVIPCETEGLFKVNETFKSNFIEIINSFGFNFFIK